MIKTDSSKSVANQVASNKI